jgi:hypothetical protein
MHEPLADDVWAYTLELLAHMLESSEGIPYERIRHVSKSKPQSLQFPCKTMPGAANLTIVGRHSDVSIAVSLKDPTAGCYVEQPWRLTRARGRGVCALTSTPIRRGDRIYRPSMRGHVPVNANWMVLASAIPVITEL